MSYRIVLSATALKELETSIDWYNERQNNLGAKFLEAVDESLKSLTKIPDIFPIKVSGYREVAITKFPFVLVYTINKTHRLVRVLHVFHTKRDPRSKAR